MPQTSGTAETALPRLWYFCSKLSSAIALPGPQGQMQFAGSLPAAMRARLTGCSRSTS